MSAFNGQKLVAWAGNEVDAEAVIADAEIVLCYFSAHWCPPCRGFTPVLKTFYENAMKADKKLVIIFVSSDQKQADMDAYFKSQGEYHAVAFNNKTLGQKLKDNCGVSGIPSLCIVDKNGGLKYNQCRGDVTGKTLDEAWDLWKSK